MRISAGRVWAGRVWAGVAALEAVAADVAVLLDLLIPTLVLLAMAAVSLVVRREGLGSLGLHRPRTRGLVWKMLAFAAAWSVFQLGVTQPVANHVSGQRQDLSAFSDLHGNVGLLAAYLVLGWTLAAFGEELAYRGYFLTRVREALGGGRTALVVAVLASSVCFGLAHDEQGLVGVVAVFVHELAHAVTANALGGQVARIVVFPIEFVVATRKIRFTRHWGRTDLGGYVTYSLDRIEAAKRHAFVAAAGPGANIVTGLLVGARVVTSHTGDIPAGPALGAAFAILSVGMGLANLLPFEGIDGMRLFRYFRPARR